LAGPKHSFAAGASPTHLLLFYGLGNPGSGGGRIRPVVAYPIIGRSAFLLGGDVCAAERTIRLLDELTGDRGGAHGEAAAEPAAAVAP
jgi:hypothetical protein